MKPISYDNYYWQNELVRLRALKFEDWETDFPDYFDSEARFLLEEKIELPPVPETVQEQYRKYADFNQETGRIMFTIETLDGNAVGGLDIYGLDERNGTFSIGIRIGREHRSKGYGTAAMRILLRYAFLERRLHKFNSGCLEGNAASEAMHKKLGCVREGVRRQVYYSGGKYVDSILFGLTKEEFIENERKFGSS